MRKTSEELELRTNFAENTANVLPVDQFHLNPKIVLFARFLMFWYCCLRLESMLVLKYVAHSSAASWELKCSYLLPHAPFRMICFSPGPLHQLDGQPFDTTP